MQKKADGVNHPPFQALPQFLLASEAKDNSSGDANTVVLIVKEMCLQEISLCPQGQERIETDIKTASQREYMGPVGLRETEPAEIRSVAGVPAAEKNMGEGCKPAFSTVRKLRTDRISVDLIVGMLSGHAYRRWARCWCWTHKGYDEWLADLAGTVGTAAIKNNAHPLVEVISYGRVPSVHVCMLTARSGVGMSKGIAAKELELGSFLGGHDGCSTK